jgi:hypothetical protein
MRARRQVVGDQPLLEFGLGLLIESPQKNTWTPWARYNRGGEEKARPLLGEAECAS